jgi:microcystin degradation protein MlrC
VFTLVFRCAGDLRAALPVAMLLLLGLHGAMVADGYDDCEDGLLTHVRARAAAHALTQASRLPASRGANSGADAPRHVP